MLLVATLFSEAPVLDETVVSKRTEFVTLNTSQANFSACRSVMFHDFVKPRVHVEEAIAAEVISLPGLARDTAAAVANPWPTHY